MRESVFCPRRTLFSFFLFILNNKKQYFSYLKFQFTFFKFLNPKSHPLKKLMQQEQRHSESPSITTYEVDASDTDTRHSTTKGTTGESFSTASTNENVLSGITISQVTPDLLERASSLVAAGALSPTALEGLTNDALRLLYEGETFALDWKCRTALGRLVVASVASDKERLAGPAAARLAEIIAKYIDRHATREAYYPLLPGAVRHPVDGTSGAVLGMLDTEGWGSLETAFTALSGVFSLRPLALTPATARILELAVRGAAHPNRFVRQAAFSVIAAACARAQNDRAMFEFLMGLDTPRVLSTGYGDVWAQVRYSASLAARAFMNLTPGPASKPYLPDDLLYPLFTSRHDEAESVRAQAKINWKLAVGPAGGKNLLAAHAARTVQHIAAQAKSDSHELRSAAIVAAGELAISVPPAAVRGQAPALLGTVLAALGDAHWSVRAAACNAYHDFAGAFPAVARAARDPASPEIPAAFLRLVADEVTCVRESAAAALGAWARTFRDEELRREMALPVLLSRAKELLAMIQNEPLPPGATKLSVCDDAIRKAHYNDRAVHTGQHSIGCCSLESSTDKHHSHKHSHSKESENSDSDNDDDECTGEAAPWQMATGGVYLAREIVFLWPGDKDILDALMPLINDAYCARWHVHYLHVQSVVQQEMSRIISTVNDDSKMAPYMELPVLKTLPK